MNTNLVIVITIFLLITSTGCIGSDLLNQNNQKGNTTDKANSSNNTDSQNDKDEISTKELYKNVSYYCTKKSQNYNFDEKIDKHVAGEKLNEYKLENLLHKRLNEVRDRDIEDFDENIRCHSELQKIARDNSKNMLTYFNYSTNISKRINRVCINNAYVTKNYWYYRYDLSDRNNFQYDTPQNRNIIRSHEDFVVEYITHYSNKTSFDNVLDQNSSVHGFGVEINREKNNAVAITHIIC